MRPTECVLVCADDAGVSCALLDVDNPADRERLRHMTPWERVDHGAGHMTVWQAAERVQNLYKARGTLFSWWKEGES